MRIDMELINAEPIPETAQIIKMWMNFAANIVCCFSFGMFIVFLYGRENSLVYRMKNTRTFLLRLALSLTCAATLLNAVTFSNPAWTEVMLNIGLALLFVWAAWFHYFKFVKPKVEEPKKKTNKITKPKRKKSAVYN